jgi:F0F1-type ATP synthase epsilon subunit
MSDAHTDASTGEVHKDNGPAKEELKDDKGKPVMAVKIASPFKTYFDENSYSISAQNATGPFDILPRHHNFITLLTPCELVVRPMNRNEQRFRISGGLMHVKADQVTVFLDI